jgi:hypothetical protein
MSRFRINLNDDAILVAETAGNLPQAKDNAALKQLASQLTQYQKGR